MQTQESNSKTTKITGKVIDFNQKAIFFGRAGGARVAWVPRGALIDFSPKLFKDFEGWIAVQDPALIGALLG